MSSSNGNGLDRKNSMPPHSVVTSRRARDERQPSIKDINELYSALQDLVNLSPGRGSRGSDDPKSSPRSRDASPLSRDPSSHSRDASPVGPVSDPIKPSNNVQLSKTKVTRAVSSPSSSPRFRHKCATLPTKAKIEAFAALMEAAEKSRDEFEKPSPGLLHKHGKVAPLGNAAGLDLAIAMPKDKLQDTENGRTPKPPCRQRSRSTPGISKATAMRKLKEKHRKITESFSKKEKVEGPTVIRNIDDLMELAKPTSGTKTKTSPFSGRRSTKRLSGSRESGRRHTADPFLTPDLIASRLDDWYQKAVAKAVNDTDFEDENGRASPNLSAEPGSRKASDSSLNSLNSISSLNSYNSACTDFSTTEDHDLVTSECRRFTEQLRNLDISKDGEDYDSDNDSGVNVKPTFIFVRESKDKLPPHVVKALSESHLNVKYGEKDPSSDGSGHDNRTSTPDGKPSKPYFYIPNLTDDQKTGFTLVVDCEGKDEDTNSAEQHVANSNKIGLAQDSNFFKLQGGACQVVHRVGLSPKVRPKSYDIADSKVDASDLLEIDDEDHDGRRKTSRTKSLYVAKEVEKKEPRRYSRNNVTMDDNDNILGISEKKWWDVFKAKPQGEVSTGRKKTKRKSSFKRN